MRRRLGCPAACCAWVRRRRFTTKKSANISLLVPLMHDRLPGNPARPDDIASSPDGPGPQAAATSSSRNPSDAERGPAAARRCLR
ncbi:MAG: hypothetical protein NTX42_05360 [Methanothrix sp.]|nr:hypothetical protein [Methanothrix sp.]